MQRVKCKKCGLITVLRHVEEEPGEFCVTCTQEKRQDEAYRKFCSTPGCPSCDGVLKLCEDRKIKLTFSLRSYSSYKNSENNKYVKYILPIKKLKFGTLCKCVNCQINWWLDDNNKTIYPITRDKLPVLEKWNLKPYTLSISQLLTISKIQKDFSKVFSISYNHGFHYEFPCRVVSKNDVRYERAVILISKVPPLDKDPGCVLFADEIKEIILPNENLNSVLSASEERVYYFYVDANWVDTQIINFVHNVFYRTEAERRRYTISYMKIRLTALLIGAVVIIFLHIRHAYPSHGWLCGVEGCKFFNASGKEVNI